MNPRTLSLCSLLLVAACGEKEADDSSPGGDDSGVTLNTLPQGDSTWEGSLEIGGVSADVVFDLTNEGGDLDGAVTFAAETGLGTYTLTGTYEPTSNQIAMAPGDWVGANPNIELNGFWGTYDPDAGTISGTVSDTASQNNNVLYGGPFLVTLAGGGGDPTPIGDRAQAFPASASFTGTMYCASVERPVGGTLDYDGAGWVSGELTFADEDLSDPHGTFEIFGVHNPDNGNITLLPGLYTESLGDRNFATFWFDGVYDPSDGSYVADHRINQGGCVPGRVSLSFTAN